MTQNSYRYLITDIYMPSGTSNPIKAELPFTDVLFNQTLNGVGSFQGKLLLSGMPNKDLDTLNQTIPMQKAIFVEHRSDASPTGAIVWGGVICTRDYDSENQILSITAQEYEYYLQRRRINSFTNSAYYNNTTQGLVYTSIDAGTILYDLVTNMQVDNSTTHKTNTNIGLACDLYSTGSAVSRTYFDFELKSVYQALKDLSQGSFFDFKVMPQYDAYNNIVLTMKVGSPAHAGSALNKVYNPATPSSATVFQFPGNLISYKYTEDGTTASNYCWGLGYGKNYNKIYNSSK